MNYAQSCSCAVLACIGTMRAQERWSLGAVFQPRYRQGNVQKGSLFPAYSASRRRQTWWLGAPQNRCHERLRVKGQEGGDEREREREREGRASGRPASMNGCRSAGTATRLHWRNSPSTSSRRPTSSWVVRHHAGLFRKLTSFPVALAF